MKPEEKAADWHRISPVSVVFFLFRGARELVFKNLPAAFVLFAAIVSGGPNRKLLLVSGLGLALLVAVAFSVLSWLRFRFSVTSDRVLVRSGVFRREELDIEFDRIQNVSIREPFYMRPFGLAILGIDTAGSSQKEIQLGGIDGKFALSLKQKFLSAGKPAATGSATEEQGGEIDGDVLLTRDAWDIVIYGLTINFLLWVAVALGFLLGGGENAEALITWLAEWVHMDQVVAALQEAGPLSAALMAAGGLLALLALLSLASVLGALYRYHGYRLTRRGETYSRGSGILSRQDESVKQHKIQAVVLRQNPVARAFGRLNMQLRVASAGAASQMGFQAAFAVPALTPRQSARFCNEFLPGCDLDAAQFTQSDRTWLVRLAIFWSAAIATPAALLLGLAVSKMLFAILPLIVFSAWLFARLFWRRSGLAVVGDYGFVRRGLFGTSTTAFPLFKVQRIDLRQSPGQRRRGLATLTVHLASHSISVIALDEAEARRFRDLALYQAESSDRAWF